MVNAPGTGSPSRASASGSWFFGLILALGALVAPRSSFAQGVPPSAAELVYNGSFSSFFSCSSCNGPSIPTWDVFVVPYDVDPATGALSVLQGGTTQALVRHHLKNSYAGALSELTAGAGAPYTVSFRVQVAEPARVRCLLAVQDSTGFRAPVVLAERTLQTPGQWTTLVATSVPTWTGTLLSADLLFDAQKVIVGSTYNPSLTNDQNPYPSFLLDDVSLVRDVDGDGLTDREEQTCTPAPGCPASACAGAASPWTASAQADTDGDALPDGWEWRHCLDPNDPSDATGVGSPPSACSSTPTPCGSPPVAPPPAWDPDCDGASNVEERGAATDPNDACQVPGLPANPGASPLAKEVLRTLALLPSQGASGDVLVGQHLDDPLLPLVLPNGIDTNEYCHFIEDLRATTQDDPAILSLEYDDCDTTQCYNPSTLIQSVNARAIAHWKKGGLVAIKWSPPNPWDAATYGGIATSVRAANTTADDPNVDLQALASGTNPRFNGYLADVAAGLLELKQNGVVVMWRPAAEMSGRHFWWGARPRDAYLAFWRYMFDTLTNQYQLNNLLWTMEADSPAHPFVPVDYYYPGDGYVDIYGQNVYRDDFNVFFDADTLSRYYPKVFAFPQAGPGTMRDGTWDLGRILYGGASGGGLENAYPRVSFFVEWSSYEAVSTGANGIFNAHVQGYQTVALVDNRAGLTPEGLFATPGVLSRAELPARTASCQDELQNQGETGIDCGGPCGPCACTSAGGAPLPDGAHCNDGNACTQRDRCQAGVCVGSVPVVCVACGTCAQSSTCNPQTGACDVTPLPDGSACNDGNPCTVDTCQSGACVGSTVPDGSSCDDDNACTQASACSAGTCVGSSPITCVASDACHAAGSCDPNTGVCSNPAAPDGTSCDDGNGCTQASACSAGVCAGSSPLPDGTSCDDANVCTSSSACSAGACVGSGSAGAGCDDGVVCTVDSCDPVLGCKHDATACCFDNLQNQGETGVDCGGPCAPCATALSVGRDHVCRMQADGTVSCWGTNAKGQLGNGTTTSSTTPSLVTGLSTAAALGAGAGHTCVALSDGVVQCWGDGALGQLGNGTTTGATTPQSVTVSGAKVTGISAGGGHSCALRADGSVACWGGGLSGQLGAGYQSTTTPVDVVGLAGPVSRVHAGGYPTGAGTIAHTCALLTGGGVQCWGYNANGQLGNGALLNSATPVSAQGITTATQVVVGALHSCALLSSGQMVCWGDNAWGQLGNVSAGTTSAVPVTVLGLAGTPLEIAAGERHTCARLASSVQCWGAGTAGQLGNGASKNSPNLPVTVSNVATVKALSAGGDRTCVAAANGSVRCWGIGVSNVPVGVSSLPTCGDGIRNQSEVGVDCGGPCAPCCTGSACCVNAANGKACNDGNACTELDTCQGGVCVGTAVSCTGAGTCHVPAGCQAGSGLCLEAQAPLGTGCDDGDACTQVDTCQSGVCTGQSPVVCAPQDDCHAAGTCDATTGACSNPGLPDGTACDDGSACTQTDACVAAQCKGASPVACAPVDGCHLTGVCDPSDGSCTSPKAADGTVCDDGDPCTLVDTCVGGACVGTTPKVCVALDACHVAGVCDSATGLCSNPDAPSGTACSDGNLCTQTDTCQQGVCVGANPVVCTAQGACGLVGVCNPALGVCSNPKAPDGTACNDGNACTQVDSCQGGFCVGASPIVCTASDQCHVAGACSPATGQCSNPGATNGTPCNDGNACTLVDTCQSGVCLGTSPITCPASDQCHSQGTCDPASGVCSNPARTDGTSCTDGNACTSGDTCQSGVCQSGTPKVCVASDQCHLAGTCDTTTGACSNPSIPNGTACNDGNACTLLDTCQSGVCTGSSSVVCTASDACHSAGTCNTTTGVCTNPNAPNGTVCDDGNACTSADKCQAGVCAGTTVACPFPAQCHTTGVCDPASGVCSNPNAADGTPCNDGNACTQTDTCQSGTCVGSNPVVCTASDQCHSAGVCNSATGVCSNPNATNGTACNDSNACTTNDRCQAGVCAGNTVTCSSPSSCQTAGSCDLATGACVYPSVANGTSCNDGNACTQTDTCQSGVCTGGNPVVCTASGACRVPGVCNTATGACSIAAAPNGTSCNDGNACTQTDTCQSGSCVGSNPKVCAPLGQCYQAGTCSPATGQCSTPLAPNGTACDDLDSCTQPDTCTNGLCKGSINCNDGNVCTSKDTCIGGVCVGQFPGPSNGLACSDNNACTQNDVCQSGVCVGTSVSGTACNDGNACTSGETCQSGVCVPASTVVCTAQDACHTAGTCDPTTGSCSNPAVANGVPCDDGNACTLSDTCQSGSCLGASPVVCPPPDQCHSAGSCNTSTGVCSNPPLADGTTCDDGTLCIQAESCQSGVCQGVSSGLGACYEDVQKLAISPAPPAGTYRQVVVQGDTAVVSVGGVAQVFERINGTFTWTYTLAASTGAALGRIALDGDTLVAGATVVGRAFVFTRTAGVWANCGGVGVVPTCTQTVTLAPNNGLLSDNFGAAVALSGDTVVVGSFLYDSGAVADLGTAYVFERTAGVFGSCSGAAPQVCLPQAQLLPTDPSAKKYLGRAVAIDGSTVVLGAAGDLLGPGKGAAYVFVRNGALWSQQARLVASAAVSFGTSVAVSGETIAVGSPSDNRAPANKAGSVYLFERIGTAWSGACSGTTTVQCPHDGVVLVASDRQASDSLGQSVELRGSTLVAGASAHDHGAIPTAVNGGAAYVLRRVGGLWGAACTGGSPVVCSEDDELLPSDAATTFAFGTNKAGLFVDVSGRTIVVGSDSGPYVFDSPLSEGCGCLVDADCVTGYCTDGVCCDAGCGASDPYDFQACSVFAGASQNGICEVVQSGVCSAGPACSAPDACQ